MSKWTRFRDKVAKKILELLGIKPQPEPAPSPTIAIDWRYGGFNGSGAVECPEAQIADLRIDARGMSYRWVKGGCEVFGATNVHDCDHALACAFWWDEAAQKWVGGKFDWISTSRTTRDWKNIYPGPDGKAYHGWEADKFFAAPKRAFCIVRKDGRLRTNLIETTEP